MCTFSHAVEVIWPAVMTKDAFERISQHLDHRRLDDAERALAELTPTTTPERRAQAHYRGVVLFYRGDIPAARKALEDALASYGENVSLFRDLMICQYHLHDMDAFRASLTRLELLLIENEGSLSDRALLESEVWLGKFMEEEARLAPARIFYDRALSRDSDADRRLFALIQKARWQALYDPSSELSPLYRELISVPAGKVNPSLNSELEHSLMLIELKLIGVEHAWMRVERAADQMVDLDRRLLLFDFVEGALGRDQILSEAALARVTRFETLDPYESYLHFLVTSQPSHEEKIKRLTDVAPKLTWSSYLRLLCLSANIEANPGPRAEFNRKIQLIIGGLDPRSQELWRRRLKRALAAPEVRVDVSLSARTIAVQGQTFDLGRKKIGLQLLSGLLKKSSLTVDEAIDLLWSSTFTPEHYHRLRMGTHRLNTLVHEGAGVGKLIEVDSQEVRLRPEVKLRSVDEFGEGEFFADL